MALGTLPSAAGEAGPQAQMAPRRRPLNLPPPTKAAGEEEEEALRNERPNDDDDGNNDPAAANVKAAGVVAAALSAMHDAAAAAAASSSSASISAAGTRSSAFQAKAMASTEMPSGTGAAAALAPASSLDQRPLPPVHTLPSPPTRSAVATLLRDHLGAPLAASDPIRECDPPVLEELPRNPREVMRVAHEKIHVFPFKDVRKCWLRAWVEGSLARATEVLENDGEELGDWVAEVVRLVDMSLILAGGVGREAACEWIFAVLERMLLEQGEERRERPAKRRKLSERDMADDAHGKDSSRWKHPDAFPNSTVRAPPLRHPIPRHESLNLADFQAHLNTAAGTQNSTDENLPGDLPQPMIITGALDHWPAISDPSRRWSDPSYLMRKTLGGRRLVPIEIGRSYTDEGWGQGIITFSEFMRKYMFHDQEDASNPIGSRMDDARGHNDDDDAASTTTTTADGEQTGYLAQHDLFAQIPSLRADIAVPDYCYSTPIPSPSPATKNATAPLPPGHPSFPLLNAWFGPADTISPLHTDPYHNVLAQVVGRKYVRLYPPGQRQRLYPRGVGPDGVDMGNTSEVDVGEAMAVLEGWDGWSSSNDDDDGAAALSAEEAWAREEDLKMRRFDFEERWPAFAKVEGCCEAVLGPGDALYVPKGWWHYVRSLAPSFSVSFWWD